MVKIWLINAKWWLMKFKPRFIRVRDWIKSLACPIVICTSFFAFGVLVTLEVIEDSCEDGFVQIYSQGYLCLKRSDYYGYENKSLTTK